MTPERDGLDLCCPCRRSYKCGGYEDHVCSGPYEVPCDCCEEPQTVTTRPCSWSGHAAHRRALAKARAETLMEVHRRTQNLRKASERVALRTWLRERAAALDKEAKGDTNNR